MPPFIFHLKLYFLILIPKEMGRSKKNQGLSPAPEAGVQDVKLNTLQQQLQALKVKQEQAMEAVLRAQQDMEQKSDETERQRRELKDTEAAKEKAGAEADFAIKTASGDEYAAQLASSLERELFSPHFTHVLQMMRATWRHRLTDRQLDWQAGRHAGRHGRQAGRQTDRRQTIQTGRQECRNLIP